jgi:SAM-dependent methyltransferase
MSLLFRVARRTTLIGERLGIDALVYNPLTMYQFDWYSQWDAPGFADRLAATFGNCRYLDVGAGTGRYSQALMGKGYPVVACERSLTGRFIGRRRHGVNMCDFDLATQPIKVPPGEFDVAFSLEVAEHLPEALGKRLVSVLCRSPIVVFTAAPPGQGGAGHINEQPKPYWVAAFAEQGHQRAPAIERRFIDAEGALAAKYLLCNLMIFEATPSS